MLLFNKTVIIFFSYIDAGIGISYFIKIFSTINQYTFQFLFIFPVLFFLIIYFFKNNELIDDQIKFDHVVIFFLISIASVGVFILSFGYPFIVFGLGNRTNLFINTFVYSLLIYAFVKYKSHRIISLSLKIFFSIILTSGILISAHWKSFSKETETVVNLIEKNCTSISNNHNNGNILIFFSGYRYSKLDKFDHVEFLAPPWVLNSFCDLKNKYFFSLSNEVSFSYDFKTFENNKYNIKYKLSDYDQIYIFDLNNKNIKETNIDEILRLNLATHDKRHWYFYSDKLIKIIKKISNGKYG